MDVLKEAHEAAQRAHRAWLENMLRNRKSNPALAAIWQAAERYVDDVELALATPEWVIDAAHEASQAELDDLVALGSMPDVPVAYLSKLDEYQARGA